MAQIQAARANTLDTFLEELPEIPAGYFSFPVDDFFDNYVEELGQRGGQGSGSLPSGSNPPPDLGEYDTVLANSLGNVSQPQPGRAQMSSAMSLDLPLIPDPTAPQPVAGIPQQGYDPTPFTNGGMPHIGQDPNDPKPHSEGSGSGVWEGPNKDLAAPANGRPKRNATAYADYAVDSGDMESDDGDNKGGGGHGTRGTGKTKRNAKQQVQNKQAQQRYRERRKQRFQEMEHTIDGLTAKVHHMSAVQHQNAMLQAKRDELEAMLQEKDRQLEAMRAQLESGQSGGAELEERSLEQRRKAEEANTRECQAKAAKHVEELKAYMQAHNLYSANPTGEGVDPEVVRQLAEMVGRGCSYSQQAMRAEGVKVLRLMSRDVAHLTRIQCLRECDKWSKILDRLRLTPLQKDQLLLMRKNHLRNLRQVYEGRQQLNMQAMGLMLPDKRMSDKGLDGKMACMSLNGYSDCARATVDLDEILNSIKENLRLEQKHVMEMNFVTMHRLLSPIQAALFLVEVYPAYCDALALANILAAQVEDRAKAAASASTSGSGELHKVDSAHSHQSPTSSGDKSDTCPLMRGELQSAQQ